MMVQNAPAGRPHFISTMAEHNDLCGQFARAFGNEAFERIEPYEEMLFAISHHDRGWDEFDADPGFDAKSGLPRGLGTTPAPVGIDSNRKSADLNERRHAYCGLVSSMHGWGLFNARYGYSQFRVRPGGSTSVPIPDAQWDAEHANDCLDPLADPTPVDVPLDASSDKVNVLIDENEAKSTKAAEPENAVGSPRLAAVEKAAGSGIGATHNPGSANYSFAAPVLALGGRESGLNLAMVFNSQLWQKDVDPSTGASKTLFDYGKGWPAPGWRSTP